MRAFTTSIIAVLATAAPAFGADTGGAAASPEPLPQSVSCARECAGLTSARHGSTVRVNGEALAAVARVVFLGRRGAGDDVRARPTRRTASAVEVVVPQGAIGGPLVLVTADGARSERTPPIDIDPGTTTLTASSTAGVEAQVEFRKAFFGGRHPAALNYMIQGSSPAEVTVALYPAGGDTPVTAWSPGAVEPGTVQRVRWNGVDAATGRAAPAGRYEFRVFSGGAGARAAQAGPSAASSFLFLDHRFPIRGRHDYGGAGGGFGAGRSGHAHQGQDVFARCGTPLVAARGGVVKFAGSQSRAGYYIVINGEATGRDYAYMHLQGRALFRKGDRVRTGDVIGAVGDTGVAHGCHLHFELWSAPGWYTGGRAVDPLPALRAWDQFS